MIEKYVLAGGQMEPKIQDKKTNLESMVSLSYEAAGEGARLVVFPECALTGIVLDSVEEVRSMAEPIPGPATDEMMKVCKDLGIYVIFGLIEEDNGRYFNSAVLTGPNGQIGKYRKIHLPGMGVDRFVEHGDIPFPIYDTELGRIGILICYDGSFPESAGVLNLKGADLIVLITNWPRGAERCSKYQVNTRAMDNHLFYAAINRVGLERDFFFFGMSKVADVWGKTLAEGGYGANEIIYAEVEPLKSRHKRHVLMEGKNILDFRKDRRPELYSLLTKSI
nr:carbon-nitrogen hydrolase family protein [Desulfobacterales bacterium]